MCCIPKNRQINKTKQTTTKKYRGRSKLCFSLMVLFWWSYENHIALSHRMNRSSCLVFLFLHLAVFAQYIYFVVVIHRQRGHRHRRSRHRDYLHATTIRLTNTLFTCAAEFSFFQRFSLFDCTKFIHISLRIICTQQRDSEHRLLIIPLFLITIVMWIWCPNIPRPMSMSSYSLSIFAFLTLAP